MKYVYGSAAVLMLFMAAFVYFYYGRSVESLLFLVVSAIAATAAEICEGIERVLCAITSKPNSDDGGLKNGIESM